jgi:hypothetical protein
MGERSSMRKGDPIWRNRLYLSPLAGRGGSRSDPGEGAYHLAWSFRFASSPDFSRCARKDIYEEKDIYGGGRHQ